MRRLTVVHQTCSARARPDEETTSYYVSSRGRPARPQPFPKPFAATGAGGEIRNHWVRDALWAEDRTRSKHWKLNANLAVLRAGLMGLRSLQAAPLSWPARFERCAFQPALALRLITQPWGK